MLILNSQCVRKALSMSSAIEAMKSAFVAVAAGDVLMPNRTHLDIAAHQGVTLVMPSYVCGDNEALAVKVVSVFPGNADKEIARIQAVVNVFDPSTGQPIAMIEGSALTAIRTAAVSGAATDFIAAENTPVLGIVGAGVQARAHIEAICCVRKVERIQIFGPTLEKVERLADEVKQLPGVPNEIAITASGNQAVEEADIVCAVSTATDPVFEDKFIKPGAHINAVGSYQPHVREIPTATVLRSRVYVDQREAAWEEAGDLIQPLRAGKITQDHIVADLGEMATGTNPAKLEGSQVSFFKSVGLAMQDAFAANACLKSARDMKLGQTVVW